MMIGHEPDHWVRRDVLEARAQENDEGAAAGAKVGGGKSAGADRGPNKRGPAAALYGVGPLGRNHGRERSRFAGHGGANVAPGAYGPA